MMSHPDSEALAWERVRALEDDNRRLRRRITAGAEVFRTWSRLARHEHGKHLGAVRSVLAGLSLALDEAAEKLTEGIG